MRPANTKWSAAAKESNAGWIVALAVMLLLVGLSQPIFLLIAWRLNIAPAVMTTANDLGGIMGAIFTAGGLVVAIVSIYTMATVQSVARRSVRPLLDSIPTEVDSRIRLFLEAYGYYTTAQRIADSGSDSIAAIESLLQQAIALEPTITGLYAFAGRRYYFVAGSMYMRRRKPREYTSYPLPNDDEFPGIISRALWYLEEAHRRNDGDPRGVSADLAEIHGMMRSPLRETLKWVETANARDEPLLPSGWRSSLFLYASCRDAGEIERMARALRQPVPYSAEDLKGIVSQFVAGPHGQQPLHLVVVAKTAESSSDPVLPGFVTLYHQQAGSVGYAQWLPRLQPGLTYMNEGIPPFGKPDNTGTQSTPQLIPMTDLLAQIVERYYVVDYDDHTSIRFPERLG